jgi:hypothetical protein
MTSRLEQAIKSGVLPESIDVYKEIAFFSIDVVDKRYWLGYVAGDSAIIGPHENHIKIYFETPDEAVDALIPIVWAQIKAIDAATYEQHCLDLMYEPLFYPQPNELSIIELGITIKIDFEKDDKEERLQFIDELRIEKIKELCANGDRVPLPAPFDNVEY